MSDGADLLALVRSTDQQIATLFGQMISITFAMIAGIYYLLNRARMPLKAFAFLSYSIGMLAFFGMMLREANIKRLALDGIGAIPLQQRSPTAEGLRQLSRSWLFEDTALLMNVAHYILWISVIFLLFFRKKAVEAARWSGRSTPAIRDGRINQAEFRQILQLRLGASVSSNRVCHAAAHQRPPR